MAAALIPPDLALRLRVPILPGFCVRDGRGREYFRAQAAPRVTFRVGGALGSERYTLLLFCVTVALGLLTFASYPLFVAALGYF